MALITVLATAVLAMPGPAAAQPDPDPHGSDPAKIAALKDNLAAAAAGYMKAESDLEASKSKQAELQTQLSKAEADLARVKKRVADYAAEAYMTGRVEAISLVLQATSKEDFIGRAKAMDRLTRADSERLVTMADAQRRVAEAKKGIDAEVTTQAAAAQEMARRRQAAEKALAAAQAPPAPPKPPPPPNSGGIPTANPAPRNSDGSWPPQGCSADDPTTTGCITPRTLHALKETQRLGFGRYVSCFRPGNKYEHPKGRACDWSATPDGFVNRSASGGDRAYGDRLSDFYVKNARALGVMYVIWYCEIWQVSTGWHRYNSAGSRCGDAPAPDHTNHLHLSIY
jgi:peptidoglycan DL-endopeptidase CwlO